MTLRRINAILMCLALLTACGSPEPAEGDNSAGSGTSSSDSSGDSTSNNGGSTTTDSLTVPTGLAATVSSQTINVTWNEVSAATSYNLYHATESFASLSDISNYATLAGGTLINDITGASSSITGLANSTTYFIVVTAEDSSEETAASAEISATPTTITADLSNVVELNDTGVSRALTTETHQSNCGSGDLVSSQQDCAFGRDVTSSDDLDGDLGFSFTKVSSDGTSLAATATSWSCVSDNVTGLMWELKQGGNGVIGDEGLHDMDDTFTWYEPSLAGSSADAGTETHSTSPSTCDTALSCNTSAYVARVNAATLCGFSDWRLPKTNELLSLIFYDTFGTSGAADVIDEDFFPRPNSTSVRKYWTGSHYFDVDTNKGDQAWGIFFRGSGLTGQAGKASGTIDSSTKGSLLGVMLVRDASDD
ncbi:DUF1566 domain-containing protein [Marinomonas mediterranea]|uniref:Lcl C-terminal domain-containing protein n=1 Tax=Marinomonas mediterranea TaxID=119864 RepID=UPI00234B5D23|nr:DUF1566 domain-containing protein [Marinomonas mediterranea]WCN14843.1 DUF1566 domain-containing protein [Marinomonas mediterranea]